MTETAAPVAAPPASKSLAARVVGVLLTPGAAYAAIAARPRWFGVLALVVCLTAASSFVFLSTEVGKQAMIDQQVQQAESFGRPIDDAAYARLERVAAYSPYLGAAAQIVVLPLVGLAVAGLAVAIFNALLGGDATFRQVFAVVAHSGVVVALGTVFTLPLAYARQTLSSPASLAVFLPFLDDNSFTARFLGGIDLFQVWWIASLAIGLGVLYRRRSGKIAATLLVVYVALMLVIAGVKTTLSGA